MLHTYIHTYTHTHMQAEELTFVNGKRVAAEGISVWNPGMSMYIHTYIHACMHAFKCVGTEGISVWNPVCAHTYIHTYTHIHTAFDVTPAVLIDGLITELGVITKAPGSDIFDVKAFIDAHKK